jgi:hypothetical protein
MQTYIYVKRQISTSVLDKIPREATNKRLFKKTNKRHICTKILKKTIVS